MKKFLEIFFITLGIIFFIIILIGIYLFVADPFGIKPLILSFTGQPVAENQILPKNSTSSTSSNPMLNAQQEKALKAIGIDPSKLPTSITPEMEKCFYEKLGDQRAGEIKNGSTPTALDLLKVKPCL
jgi:hypothetical protein